MFNFFSYENYRLHKNDWTQCAFLLKLNHFGLPFSLNHIHLTMIAFFAYYKKWSHIKFESQICTDSNWKNIMFLLLCRLTCCILKEHWEKIFCRNYVSKVAILNNHPFLRYWILFSSFPCIIDFKRDFQMLIKYIFHYQC